MRSLESIRQKIRKKKLRESFASYRNRALALLLLNLIGFLVFGRGMILPGMPDDEWVALDQWVRTAVFAVVRPTNTTPVTYVDIDNTLYRDVWGMPVVTPRNELLKMVSTLTTSGAWMVVVDIDLAWGDADPSLEEFFANYKGPVPLVFVRHLEESADGLREIMSPYDALFQDNSEWLRWAHAYFFSDGDGALREWLPWVVVCSGEDGRPLPSVATVAGQVAGFSGSDQPGSGKCIAADELVAYPIIYTEEFGFIAPGDAEAAWLPNPNSPARKIAAQYLLDGTTIDLDAVFKDRVAILGGSHTAGQDLRLTPMGVLPGAVVQANTVIHANPQLASVGIAQWLERLIVATLFLVLCLLAFPVAALVLVVLAAISTGSFSYYAIFGQIEMAVLLFIQFRLLAWIAEPFWQDFRDCGWRILLPDYLREPPEE